ncbi:MAG: cobalamin-binding protein [Woeseiaceae bacterium]|nr:cobalamin-binding protein [Woeseiaceae bacterium]
MLLAGLLQCAGCGEQATESATEDAPVDSIVTLAPHLAELVFAAGAGDRLTGVSAWSDYPPAVAELPIISDAFTVDQEQLAVLQPSLILAWQSGTPQHVVDELRASGHRVEAIVTRSLDDVARAIEKIGELTGNASDARSTAAGFRDELERLSRQYAERPELTVFYQVSAQPLYTVNGEHYIGEILSLCGGRNVFAELGELAPAVTVESVLDRDPEVLLAGAAGGAPFDEWQRWPSLAALRYGNLFTVSADEIGRPGTRLVTAIAEVCERLEDARRNIAD